MNIQGNEARCTSCHAGYGWKDAQFDFSPEVNVDCLVCHEQTGTYKEFPTLAGRSAPKPMKFGGKTFYPPDWNKVAQSVARPKWNNCGTCHFFGGGCDGVKHGDLDSSLLRPGKELSLGILGALKAGAAIGPGAVMDRLEDSRAGVLVTSPQLKKKIADILTGLPHLETLIVVNRLPGQYDLASLRHMRSVGEPLNPEAVLRGEAVLGKPFHDNWWQTETGAIMISNHPVQDIKPGSMGRP